MILVVVIYLKNASSIRLSSFCVLPQNCPNTFYGRLQRGVSLFVRVRGLARHPTDRFLPGPNEPHVERNVTH